MALNEVRSNGLHLSYNIFQSSSTLKHNKNKQYKVLDYYLRDVLNLKKHLELVYPPHSVYDF